MFSHVTVGCLDLESAERFYDATLSPLGFRQRTVVQDGGPQSKCWVSGDAVLPRFYVYLPYDDRPASAGNGTMVAILAPSAAAVNEAYYAGVEHSGSDEGMPGPRPQYGDGYCGAYLRDPDGNKVHLAYRGDLIPAKAPALPETGP